MTIPYGKFNRNDWLEIFGYFIMSAMLFSFGIAFLK